MYDLHPDVILNQFDEHRGDQTHHQEKYTRDRHRFGKTIVLRTDQLGDLHDFSNRDKRQQRCFLEDRHQIIAQRGDNGRATIAE